MYFVSTKCTFTLSVQVIIKLINQPIHHIKLHQNTQGDKVTKCENTQITHLSITISMINHDHFIHVHNYLNVKLSLTTKRDIQNRYQLQVCFSPEWPNKSIIKRKSYRNCSMYTHLIIITRFKNIKLQQPIKVIGIFSVVPMQQPNPSHSVRLQLSSFTKLHIQFLTPGKLFLIVSYNKPMIRSD